MSFDNLTLQLVTAQLNETIASGKILSVIQSSPLEFTLRIAVGDEPYNLFFSIHPVHARVHLTSGRPRISKRWHFADFLQNHIAEGEITNIEQINSDRIIRIRIVPQEEIMESKPKLLIGEFMGKHSNVILVEENTGKILESMKHIDETMSRFREVLPGLDYAMPPVEEKLDPFSVDQETLANILASGDAAFWKKLLKNFQGMSPLLAKEIVARASDDSPEAVRDSFVSLMSDIRGGNFCPTVVTKDSEKRDVVDVSAIELKQFRDHYAAKFSTISEALEFFYDRISLKESLQAERASILQAVKKKYEALQEKQIPLQNQLETAQNADELKLKGELLTANIYRIEGGWNRISLQNFYDPDGAEVAIELDEKLGPAENAQKYFEKYKKARRSKDVLIKLTSANQRSLDYLQKVMDEAEKATELEVLNSIRGSLERKGIIREKKVDKQKPKEETPLFRRFKSSDGFQILVGRNDKENELLLKGESSKHDMWLHAKQIEGSHVIVRNPEKRPDIPKRSLLEAGIIAASFSKGRHSGMVPVDYTWVKYVNKPRGGKLGFVTYTHEKTLFVSPSDFDKMVFSSSEDPEFP